MSPRGEERSCLPIPTSRTLDRLPQEILREREQKDYPSHPGLGLGPPASGGRARGRAGHPRLQSQRVDGPFAALRFVTFPSRPGSTSPRPVTRGSHAPALGLGAGVGGVGGRLRRFDLWVPQANPGTCTEEVHSKPVWRG